MMNRWVGGPDDHLRSELHARGTQIEGGKHVAPERAHAAVGVAHAGAEEEVEDPRQHGVADVAMQPGHGARLDVVHAVAHHQLGAVLELCHEAGDLTEVVGEIGVGHHDVLAPRGGEARQVGTAVAPPALEDHPCPGRLGDLGAAILGVVVDDQHLSGEPAGHERLVRVVHALLDVLLLVQAGDHDGHQRRGSGDLCIRVRGD
jgi:hypothetical protein